MIKALIIVISLSFIVPCFGGCIKEETSPVNGNTQPETPPQAGSIIWHIGDKWEWKRNDNKSRTEEVVNITSINGNDYYKVINEEDLRANFYYAVQSLGLCIQDIIGVGTMTYTPPEIMILPLENKTYNSSAHYEVPGFGSATKNETTTIKFCGIETVIVPAGEFKTYNLSIHVADAEGAGSGPIQLWFSPEVKNFVKQVLFWGNDTYVLTSYKLHE